MGWGAGRAIAGGIAALGLGLGALIGPSAAPAAQEAPVGTPAAGVAETCDPRIALEAPQAEGPLRGIVTVGGWAIDLASPSGTGVSDVHVYLDGYGSEPGYTFIGRAQYGAPRVDVAQQFNDVRFARSAYSLSWDASTAGGGAHTLVILYKTRCGWSSLTQPVEVEGPTIQVHIETPPQGSLVAGPVRIEGWAADPRAEVGTGVERMDLYVDGQLTTLGVPLGEVAYGENRQDVGAALGRDREAARVQFTRTGFGLFWNPSGLTPGTHNLTFYARGPDGAVARSITLDVAAGAAGPRATATLGGVGTQQPRPTEGSFPLVIGATTPTSVSLVWSPLAGAVSYDLYVSEGVTAFFAAQTGLSENRVIAAALAPGRTYRFFVRASDAAGNELARSATVSATTGNLVVTPTVLPTITPRPSPTIPNQF